MDPSFSDWTPIGGMIAIAMIFSELVKLLINRMTKKPGCSGLSQKEHDALMGTYRVLSKLDGDGVPMAYTKRSYESTQKEILNEIRESNSTQKAMLLAIERLEKRASIAPGPRGTRP